jgi:PhnB protein
MAVKKIPEGYGTVTPYLVVKDAAKLMDFIKAAFGAQELFRMDGPDGRVAHAEAQIGTSRVMMGSPMEPGKETKAMLHLYVEDCDAMYEQALKAGATTDRAPADQFYGDRSAGVKDPFGNYWYVSTHVEDVSPEEMERRMQKMATAK